MKRTYTPIPFHESAGPEHVLPNACWATPFGTTQGMWLDFELWHRQYHGARGRVRPGCVGVAVLSGEPIRMSKLTWPKHDNPHKWVRAKRGGKEIVKCRYCPTWLYEGNFSWIAKYPERVRFCWRAQGMVFGPIRKNGPAGFVPSMESDS